MTKTILVTVSDDRFGRKGGQYEKIQKHIKQFFKENKSFGITDHYSLTHKEFSQSQEYRENFEMQSDPDPQNNGRAYKPYAIREGLRKINDGDYLIYNDCSPEIWGHIGKGAYTKISRKYDLDKLKFLCDHNGGILTPYNVYGDMWHSQNHTEFNEHTHKNYTLNICMDTMGLREYENSFQHASGLVVLRKNDKSVKFVDDWLKWNLIPECGGLVTWLVEGHEELSEGRCHGGKKHGHRHDQSISGLLVNELDLNLVNTFDVLSVHEYSHWCLLSLCIQNHDYRFVDSNLYK